ncbi:MAG: HAMP domain-containing histidine kinase [Oscillatoriales cyanobacterium RM1_1_9]|nr:HAMP domain-containing histidine kinase [Oscillatoriales cyanobacterium SM2_3_0]NJO46403.1 HAMP domain-containing histidine kinase [Oscillatoriales cyanobacterium RM2_1_1]NJO72203.1 HAMP domain-containing histidine kinase [Oscillatoriales cyanobacterium RM1_1_9]
MGGNELLFLGIGLGLGFGISNFFSLRSPSIQSATFSDQYPQDSQNSQDSQNVSQDQLQALSSQLHQTQMAYQMAVEMGRFKEGFLARTSHELRSPLNSMIGMLQLILTDLCESPEEEREFTQQAYDSALKFVGLLDEAVYVAKTAHGIEQMKIQPIQLSKLFQDVKKLIHLQAANRSIRLSFEAVDPNVYILADLPRMRQVLVSLIDIALTQMNEGKVRVSASPNPNSNYVHVYIDDQRPLDAWSESSDLLQSTSKSSGALQLSGIQSQGQGKIDEEMDFKHDSKTRLKTQLKNDLTFSPGMRLIMSQILLEEMQGSLEMLALPTDENSTENLTDFTRTQCSIPFAPVP